MIRKAELGRPVHTEVIAEPTPLGLICLAIGCAALTPIAFGASLTPAGLDFYEQVVLGKTQFA